jgi:hypothetical protein
MPALKAWNTDPFWRWVRRQPGHRRLEVSPPPRRGGGSHVKRWRGAASVCSRACACGRWWPVEAMEWHGHWAGHRLVQVHQSRINNAQEQPVA